MPVRNDGGSGNKDGNPEKAAGTNRQALARDVLEPDAAAPGRTACEFAILSL